MRTKLHSAIPTKYSELAYISILFYVAALVIWICLVPYAPLWYVFNTSTATATTKAISCVPVALIFFGLLFQIRHNTNPRA